MRRLSVLVLALAAALSGAAAPAAVIERLSTSLEPGVSPIPALSISGPVTGSLVPAFAPSLTVVSLGAPTLTPAPALLPAVAAPAAEPRPIAVPQAAVAFAAGAPVVRPLVRGPPTAKDAEFSAVVAKSVADKAAEWSVPAAEILDGHDALLVGENHRSLASVNELARALPSLAKAGVAVLGIEGLKRPNQDAVDAYVSGRADVLPAEVLAFSPSRRTAFEGLLKSARSAGVRVIALGTPLDAWARQAAELAAEKTGDPKESFLAAPGDQLYRAQVGYEPGYNEAVAEVYLTRRNRSMAGFLAEAMLHGAKAVVLVGQNHVDGPDPLPFKFLGKPDWGTMPRELAKLGLKAFSLTLTGGVYTDAEAARDDREVRRASYAQAHEISERGKPAYTRTGEATGLYHAGGTVDGVPASRARH